MNKRLLMMDDDRSIQDVLSMFLEQECGFEVWTTDNESQVLKYMNDKKFDVLLLNYWQETPSTLYTIKKAKELGIRVYAMTTRFDYKELEKKLNVTACFKKPFEIEEIILKLH